MNALAVNGGMTRELNRPIFLYGVDRQGVMRQKKRQGVGSGCSMLGQRGLHVSGRGEVRGHDNSSGSIQNEPSVI
jgi:hypothetical protein